MSDRPFHPDNNLPGCMLPDGGECCEGHAAVCADWHRQREEIDRLRERCDAYKGQVEAGAAEIRLLRAQLAEARKALEDVTARARFELDHPTPLRDTAFSLIEKAAKTALHNTTTQA